MIPFLTLEVLPEVQNTVIYNKEKRSPIKKTQMLDLCERNLKGKANSEKFHLARFTSFFCLPKIIKSLNEHFTCKILANASPAEANDANFSSRHEFVWVI